MTVGPGAPGPRPARGEDVGPPAAAEIGRGPRGGAVPSVDAGECGWRRLQSDLAFPGGSKCSDRPVSSVQKLVTKRKCRTVPLRKNKKTLTHFLRPGGSEGKTLRIETPLGVGCRERTRLVKQPFSC